MTKLSVNLNKIALLRNSRTLGIPSVVRAAVIALDNGANGITVHPRPDGRHIRADDVRDLAALLKRYPGAEFNIEGNPFQGVLDIVREVRPQQVTLVPDDPGALTSDHGWDLLHQGVCHQVMIEEGYITPGAIVIGADSHSNTYGAMGAFGTGLGSTEIGVAWVTGKCWFKVPETLRVELSGQTQAGVYAKDVMIHIAGLLGMDGGTYRSVEFGGEYIDNLPMHERIIFPNMSTEIGAKCGLIAADDVTINYLENETPAQGPFERIVPVNPRYERILEVNVSVLAPQVSCHPDVDNVKPLTDVEGLEVNEVYIGTCTNARYEDLEIVANMLKGKKVNPLVRVIVTPASDRIYKKALNNGLIEILMDAGCTVTGSGCGACIGRHGGILAPGERALTTMNRNFIGRMGSPLSEIYLASPATAAATALAGRITDPRTYSSVVASEAKQSPA